MFVLLILHELRHELFQLLLTNPLKEGTFSSVATETNITDTVISHTDQPRYELTLAHELCLIPSLRRVL